MAKSVFLDTVGLVALLNKDDHLHETASNIFKGLGRTGRRVLTTDFVLGEVGNVLARTSLRSDVGWLYRHAAP